MTLIEIRYEAWDRLWGGKEHAQTSAVAVGWFTDGGEGIPHAIEQAERFRSELVLLRAISPLLPSSGLSPMERGWIQQQTCEWARDYLESIATQVRTRGVRVKVVIIREPPHEAITRFAEANSVGLIVICSRGQSGPSRWLMGSVADRVVRGATVPVLLVRASGQTNNGQPEGKASRN